MEVWIYAVIGLFSLLIILGIIVYCYMRNRSKILKQDLFDGDAYCYVVNKVKKGNYLGKRKTYASLGYTKNELTA